MRDETSSSDETAARAGFLALTTGLVHAHRGRLLGLARRQGLAADEALDCVQEAFSTFLCRSDASDLAHRPEEAGRLLSTLVVNAALNQRRKLQRREAQPLEDAAELEADLPSADALVAQAEARAELVRCVERLSQMQQAVVRLRLLDERPGEEVSELLGVTAENVRSLLFRARQRLRECLTLSAELDGVHASRAG